jgi:hypothetical protein
VNCTQLSFNDRFGSRFLAFFGLCWKNIKYALCAASKVRHEYISNHFVAGSMEPVAQWLLSYSLIMNSRLSLISKMLEIAHGLGATNLLLLLLLFILSVSEFLTSATMSLRISTRSISVSPKPTYFNQIKSSPCSYSKTI